MAEFEWVDDIRGVDLDELSNLYRIAPLGEKPPAALATVFANSMFKCFVYADEKLIGAGRALADGLDCAYIADVAVHPDHQGRGLGKAIIHRLVELSSGHKKDHPLRQPRHRGLLPRPRVPSHEHSDGDLARPGRRTPIGTARRRYR
jgi:GNAT superfamily N-acetyltransferase